MPDNPYTNHYKTLDDFELLDIIDNAGDYQPLAVETARLELQRRALTPEQMEEAKERQREWHKEDALKQESAQQIKTTVTSAGKTLLDTIQPFQIATEDVEKEIKLVIVFSLALFLYQVYKEFGFLSFMLNDKTARWDISMVFYMLPLFIQPFTALLLWRRMKAGWMLGMIYACYVTAAVVVLFLTTLATRPPSGYAENMFPTPSPVSYLATLFLFGGFAWALCRPKIREAYNISTRSLSIAIGAGVVAYLLLRFLL